MTEVTDVVLERRVAPLLHVEVTSVDETEEVRWRQWKAKGRADDLRFRRTVRTVVVDGLAIIALGGAVWYGLQF